MSNTFRTAAGGSRIADRSPPASRSRLSAPTITPSPDESTNDTSCRSIVTSDGCAASTDASSLRNMGDVATSISPCTTTTGFWAVPVRSSVSGANATSEASGSRVIALSPNVPRVGSRVCHCTRVGTECLEATHQEARHVHLADSDVLRDLRLCQPFEEPQVHDGLLALGQQ